jgi:hypothetical protein
MGWLKTIGSFLLGGGSSKGADNVMKVASGVGGWIDGQQFTEQERAAYNSTLIEAAGKFMEHTIGENTERSITRRQLALLVIRFELILLSLVVILYKFDPEYAEFIYKIATTDPMNYLVLGIGAFFFMSHIVRASKGN